MDEHEPKRDPIWLGALLEVDRARSQLAMSPQAVRRVAERVEATLGRRAWIRHVRVAVVAACVVGLALALARGLGTPTQVLVLDRPARPTVSAFSVQGADCEVRDDGRDRVAISGVCTTQVAAPKLRIRSESAVALARIDDHTLELEHGTALFEVAARRDTPVQVRVPGGVIEILGTVFRVTVWPGGGGEIALFEGSIRFRDADGVRMLAPGERLRFGGDGRTHAADPELPAASVEVPPTIEATTPVRTRREPTRPSVVAPVPDPQPRAPESPAAIIADVQRLRSAGRHAEAERLLELALERAWPTRAAEILDYELGTLYQRHADHRRACDHWAQHLARFEHPRYAADIARARTRLGCD